VAANLQLGTAPGVRASVVLVSTDADRDPQSFRIVAQPHHGSVALSGNLATYIPEAGYSGPDCFSYVASDGFSDSNLGLVSVNVGNPVEFGTRDSDGDGLSDLVEYALGLSPDFPSVTSAMTPLFLTENGRGRLAIRVSRALAPMDARVRAEVSSDLSSWQPASVTSDTPWLFEARDPYFVDESPGRFIRLKVER
jgi:hypothetical protein